MKISFFGTGLMGEPMARILIESGHELTVYNRTTHKTKSLVDIGAEAVLNPAEAKRMSDIWIIMLSDYNAIDEVLVKTGNDYSGKTVIQMSTISPSQSQNLNKIIKENGGVYLEAPVLGSIPQIINRSLFVLVGAEQSDFKRWLSLLKEFGEDVKFIGDVGKASALKLGLNQFIASQTVTFSMSLGYLLNKDVNIDIFMEILRKSALYAPTFDKKLEKMLKGEFKELNFPLKHLLKDVNLIRDDFSAANINTSVIESIKNILNEGIEKNYSDEDYSALYKIINPGE